MFQMAVQLFANNNSFTTLGIAMVVSSMLLWINSQECMAVQLVRIISKRMGIQLTPLISSNTLIRHRNILKLTTTADKLDQTTVAAVIRRITFQKGGSSYCQIMFTRVTRLRIHSSSNSSSISARLAVVVLWWRCIMGNRISISMRGFQITSKHLGIRKFNSTKLSMLLLLLRDKSQSHRT